MECVKQGWSNSGRWERDGGGKGRGWVIHPHFRSPSTFQPWLRLSLDLSVLLVISIRYTLFRPVCVAVGRGGYCFHYRWFVRLFVCESNNSKRCGWIFTKLGEYADCAIEKSCLNFGIDAEHILVIYRQFMPGSVDQFMHSVLWQNVAELALRRSPGQ